MEESREARFHHGFFIASLASSGESEDGAPPPYKKSRSSGQEDMQANGSGSHHNGTTHNGVLETNGGPSIPAPTIKMTRTDEDTVRLIGQYLTTIGLE